jgi:hypothetical protein
LRPGASQHALKFARSLPTLREWKANSTSRSARGTPGICKPERLP